VFETPNIKRRILVGPSGDFMYNGFCNRKIHPIILALTKIVRIYGYDVGSERPSGKCCKHAPGVVCTVM
jgi:hypothetical protein